MDVTTSGADAPIGEEELAVLVARARENGMLDAAEVERLAAELRRLWAKQAENPWIDRSPGKCGGAPRVAGTRTGVHHIVALAGRYGWDLERLRASEFPDLTPTQIEAAVDYYRQHPEEIEAALRRDQETFDRLPAAPVMPARG